jgi:hypothetical protein
MNRSVEEGEVGAGAGGAQSDHRSARALAEVLEVATGFGIVLLVSQRGAGGAASSGSVHLWAGPLSCTTTWCSSQVGGRKDRRRRLGAESVRPNAGVGGVAALGVLRVSQSPASGPAKVDVSHWCRQGPDDAGASLAMR